MTKNKQKNAAKRRQNKALKRRAEKREAKALRNADPRKADSQSTSRKASRKAKAGKLRTTPQSRIEARVAACSSMKQLKSLAKEVGVQGYSSWTAKQRSEAEACIVATAIDLGVA